MASRSGTVQTFALALHELTTKALKYGALKPPGAHLAINWRVELAQTSGPGAVRRGRTPRYWSGSTLIEQSLPYQIGAKTKYIIEYDSVRCSIALPVQS